MTPVRVERSEAKSKHENALRLRYRYAQRERYAWLGLLLLIAPAAFAGERCLAVDGDTLVCNKHKIRLTNVYAAELNQPGGAEARRRLRAIIASGDVTLRPFGTDRYGRTLAEVYVNGRRIEQGDIGPRAGNGATWGVDRHHWRGRPRKPR